MSVPVCVSLWLIWLPSSVRKAKAISRKGRTAAETGVGEWLFKEVHKLVHIYFSIPQYFAEQASADILGWMLGNGCDPPITMLESNMGAPLSAYRESGFLQSIDNLFSFEDW
jgi:hypothetical protein